MACVSQHPHAFRKLQVILNGPQSILVNADIIVEFSDRVGMSPACVLEQIHLCVLPQMFGLSKSTFISCTDDLFLLSRCFQRRLSFNQGDFAGSPELFNLGRVENANDIAFLNPCAFGNKAQDLNCPLALRNCSFGSKRFERASRGDLDLERSVFYGQ